jgi:hypothetical protein
VIKNTMNPYQTALTGLQYFASEQKLGLQDACNKHALLLDFRAVEIIGASPFPNWSDAPLTYSMKMTSYDLDGKVIESRLIGSTRHVFSGLVEIITPQVVDGGIEYGTFKVIETKSAFPDLPAGKLIFAHVDQDRHHAPFGVLWVRSPALCKDQTSDPQRRLRRLRELKGTATYARGEWKFSGITALVESEQAERRKRSAEKTIRADLKMAAQSESDEKKAGVFDGFGQR